MTYKVVEVLFFASDKIIAEHLTWEEANTLKEQYDEGNGDDTYRWYEIKEE